MIAFGTDEGRSKEEKGDPIADEDARRIALVEPAIGGSDYLVIALAIVFSNTNADALPLNSMRFN